jgi:hypothetical protein
VHTIDDPGVLRIRMPPALDLPPGRHQVVVRRADPPPDLSLPDRFLEGELIFVPLRLAPGLYQVRSHRAGAFPETHAVTIVSGRECEVRLLLRRALMARAEFLFPRTGAPLLEDIDVTLRQESGEVVEVAAVRSSKAPLTKVFRLAPGRYVIEAGSRDRVLGRADFELSEAALPAIDDQLRVKVFITEE